jgi:hypothetical protein
MDGMVNAHLEICEGSFVWRERKYEFASLLLNHS